MEHHSFTKAQVIPKRMRRSYLILHLVGNLHWCIYTHVLFIWITLSNYCDYCRHGLIVREGDPHKGLWFKRTWDKESRSCKSPCGRGPTRAAESRSDVHCRAEIGNSDQRQCYYIFISCKITFSVGANFI